jgi:hypothetical protein
MRVLSVLPVLPVEDEAILDPWEKRPSGDGFEAGGSHACLWPARHSVANRGTLILFNVIAGR